MSAFQVSEETYQAIGYTLYRRISDNREYVARKVEEAICDYAERVQVEHNDPSADRLVETVEHFINDLQKLNAESVAFRYRHDVETVRPIKIPFSSASRLLSDVQLVKQLHCVDYQCCETSTWEDTPAAKCIDTICAVVAASHLESSPEYNQAAWD